MVRTLFLLVFCFTLSGTAYGEDILVEASIEDNRGYAGKPIKGIITVTHPPKAKVETKSFQYEGNPIQVDLAQQGQVQGDQSVVVDIFHFSLGPKPVGLYILSPFNVKVGDQIYSSNPTSYQIVPLPAIESNKTEASPVQQAPFLMIESFFDGPKPFYPGQRAKIGYRIYYTYNIEISEEEFPLLMSKDFLKIGDEQIQDVEKDHISLQQITQEIEASKIGTFTYGPAKIEGMAYEENVIGGRKYYPNKLHAEDKGLTIVVDPLPLKEQPTSYQGAVGQFQLDVKLASSAEVFVGDTLTLEVVVSGEGNLASLSLPDISCQPGFSGFFDLNDISAAGEVSQNAKRFLLDIRPISSFLTHIPPLEFSYFDQKADKYVVLRSQPIPITVKTIELPNEVNAENVALEASVPQLAADGPWREVNKTLPVIEIKSNASLLEAELVADPFTTWRVLYLIPLAMLILILQIVIRRWVQ